VVFPLLDLKTENIQAYFDLSNATIEESTPSLTQISNEEESWCIAGLASLGYCYSYSERHSSDSLLHEKV
jgi:hypothetical protein